MRKKGSVHKSIAPSKETRITGTYAAAAPRDTGKATRCVPAPHAKLIPVSFSGKHCPGVFKTSQPHLSIWFVGFHQFHSLASPHEHDLGVPKPSHMQHVSSDESHHPGGSTAQTLDRVKKNAPNFK